MSVELENLLFAVLSYIVEVSMLLAFYFFLLKCRFKHKLRVYILSVIGYLCLGMTVRMIWSDSIVLRMIVSFALFVLPIFFFFEDSLKKRISIVIAYFAVSFGAELAAYGLLRFISPLNWEAMLNYEVEFRIGVVLVDSLISLLSVYFSVFWRRVVDKKKNMGELLFLFIPTYQMLLLVMYYRACQEYTTIHSYFGLAIIIMGGVIDFLFMHFINGMEQKIEVEEKLSNLYTQRQYELDYYKMTNQHIEEMREVRHDFKNQIQTAYIMLEQGADKERIRQLLKDAGERLGEDTCTE